MSYDRKIIEAAIQASGGINPPKDQVDGLWGKLLELEKTGRYSGLLQSFRKANNKSNLLATVLEATFAHQFAIAGMSLAYEVKQTAGQASTIDFRLDGSNGGAVYFELRLLQQDEATVKYIDDQLSVFDAYSAHMDGKDEQKAILRLQSAILQKVQNRNGTPIKFMPNVASDVNIVVIAVSDVLLGTMDSKDCLLTMYGDPEVPLYCRRGIFGLLQQPRPEDPATIQTLAAKHAHIQGTLHGVLFLFRENIDYGVLDYRIKQVIVWNRHLIEQGRARILTTKINSAIPPLA